MPKIFNKANVQNNNPGTPVSAGTMAIFDNGIDALDTKIQNLPGDGSFDPNTKADLIYLLQELAKKMNIADFNGDGTINMSSKADVTYVNEELDKKVTIELGKILMLVTDKTKLDGIEEGAEVNNISDVSASSLTGGNNSTLHYHTEDRNTDNHTSGTNNKVFSAADKTKLDGIEAGAKAGMTAADILTQIKTVDGSGSGLDADKIDGIHFWNGTQAAYDAIGTKDSTTFYIIQA